MAEGVMLQVGKQVLSQNLALQAGEQLLIIADATTLAIGEAIFQAGKELGAHPMLLKIMPLGRSGREPQPVVAQAMAGADVVVAATAHSLTHTQARKKACAAGARIATMPGITPEMFTAGAMTADYDQIAARTQALAELLNEAKEAVLEKDNRRLRMSLTGREAIASTGIYREKGKAGNLPSGEAFIAPLEGTGDGEIVVDGSFSGLGKLTAPLKLEFREGELVRAEGPEGEQLLTLLGDKPKARNLAELGIGTNEEARVIGVTLEDEKVYGTVHIALGSNDTFGGKVAAGIHLDGVILSPNLYLDGKLVLSQGHLLPHI